jgi:hypothetical protein
MRAPPVTLPTWSRPEDCPYDVEPGTLPGQLEIDGLPAPVAPRQDQRQPDLFDTPTRRLEMARITHAHVVEDGMDGGAEVQIEVDGDVRIYVSLHEGKVSLTTRDGSTLAVRDLSQF